MEGVLFQALIVPHRSLSRRGVAAVIGLIVICSALILVRVWLIRAWPVMAFGVIETGLAVTLLCRNARRTHASELIMLTERQFTIIRTDAAGRRTELCLPAGWLTVVLEDTPGQVPRILASAQGAREEIATLLGEAERRDLAKALRDALWRMRNPIFDNPQLRA